MKYKDLKRKSEKNFKRAVGIPRVLFELLAEVVGIELKKKHKKGGRKPKLGSRDILLLTLSYYRDYNTFFSLGNMYGIDESNAWRWIKWCEKVIAVSFGGMIDIRTIDTNHEQIVDVTECTILRPKDYDIQLQYYSGKKKKHTIKIQIIIDEVTGRISGIAFDKGSVHDFELFKKSTCGLSELLNFLADSGYQGIQNLFEKSLTPKKKSKLHPLTPKDKELNHLISSIRISVEHVNCQLKIFRILSERYRSRIKTFFRRAYLICCFYNFCL